MQDNDKHLKLILKYGWRMFKPGEPRPEESWAEGACPQGCFWSVGWAGAVCRQSLPSSCLLTHLWLCGVILFDVRGFCVLACIHLKCRFYFDFSPVSCWCVEFVVPIFRFHAQERCGFFLSLGYDDQPKCVSLPQIWSLMTLP